MKVIVKEPGRAAYEAEVENNLEDLQEAVGGYIQAVPLMTDFVIICDEEGRLKGKLYNCEICGVSFVGTILICGQDNDEFADAPVPLKTLKPLMPQLGGE